MKKRIFVLVALGLACVATGVTASAATMPVVTVGVGNGSAAIAKCDPDGFTASSFTTNGGKVTSVTLGGIDPACAGGRVTVNLTQGTTSVATGGPVTVTGTSLVVALSGSPDAWIVDGLRAVVIGP